MISAAEVKARLIKHLTKEVTRVHSDFVLPALVLARLDVRLGPMREKVQKYLDDHGQVETEDDRSDGRLKRHVNLPFYNQSGLDLCALSAYDGDALWDNWQHYLRGFSKNVKRDVLDRFRIETYLERLSTAGALTAFTRDLIELQSLLPESDAEMGKLYDSILQLFADDTNDSAAENFTPRDVVRLVVGLLLAPDTDRLNEPGAIVNLYEPAFGTAGMLVEMCTALSRFERIHSVTFSGHEKKSEVYARGLGNIYMRGLDSGPGIFQANCLDPSQQPSPEYLPHYALANPPFGEKWDKDDERFVEAQRGPSGPFAAGEPHKNDSSLLFLQQMISRFRTPDDGGTRCAIIFNASPLFTGDAGSGPSDIRKWLLLEEDLVEAIVKLPDQLFFSTGIDTYVWILSNRKPPERQGKVQLLDASSHFENLRKNVGAKRKSLSEPKREAIVGEYMNFEETENSKIFADEYFGYNRIKVERPLRENYWATHDRIERLHDEKKFQNLASTKKKDPDQKAAAIAAGEARQRELLSLLAAMPETLYRNRDAFTAELDSTASKARIPKLKNREKKIIWSALAEKDADADPVMDGGVVIMDNDLKDYERVPFDRDIQEYFDTEVKPYVSDAQIKHSDTQVGCQVPFTREFYEYKPPRPLNEIQAEMKALRLEIDAQLMELEDMEV